MFSSVSVVALRRIKWEEKRSKEKGKAHWENVGIKTSKRQLLCVCDKNKHFHKTLILKPSSSSPTLILFLLLCNDAYFCLCLYYSPGSPFSHVAAAARHISVSDLCIIAPWAGTVLKYYLLGPLKCVQRPAKVLVWELWEKVDFFFTYQPRSEWQKEVRWVSKWLPFLYTFFFVITGFLTFTS